MLRSRLSRRSIVLGAAALAALMAAGAYGFLVLTTSNQPPAASLAPAPSNSAFSVTDPSGTWIVPAKGGGFVGYRARELLAVDFVASPNEAVGRTTEVSGSLQIVGEELRTAEITANVSRLRSDDDLRDQHLVEGLRLAANPNAVFRLTDPVHVNATRGATSHAQVAGSLTLRDQTRAVTADLDARWDGPSISVAGAVAVHRSDFDLAMPQLLVFRVADEFTIEFQLTFVPSCSPDCVAGGPSPGPLPSGTAGPSANPSGAPVPSGQLVSTVGQLAFSGFTDEGPLAPIADIYAINADGSSLQNITNRQIRGDLAEAPTWSPDGRSIAYTLRHTDPDSELGLWRVNTSTGASTRITEHPARRPSWSPDGRSIAFVGPEEAPGLFIINGDGSGLRAVPMPDGTPDHPAWSRDGKRLAFAFFPKNGNTETIMTVALDGTGAAQLVAVGTYDYAPSWRRDGDALVFVQDGNVAIAGGDGSNPRLVTTGRSVDRPEFSPDGNRLVFTQNDGLWLMNADGSGATLLEIDVGFAGLGTWRPTAH